MQTSVNYPANLAIPTALPANFHQLNAQVATPIVPSTCFKAIPVLPVAVRIPPSQAHPMDYQCVSLVFLRV